MSSVNLQKASAPTVPDAGDNQLIAVSGVATSVDLGYAANKFVRIYATTEDVYLSAGFGLASSVTDPTDLAGANPGIIVYAGTYQDWFIPPFAPLAPAGTGGATPRSYFMKLVAGAASDVLLCVTSR